MYVNPVHIGMLHIAPPIELYKSNQFDILQRLEVKSCDLKTVISCHVWRCEFRSGSCRAMLG